MASSQERDAEFRNARVLELGAGAGLAGIVAESSGGSVVQTDRQETALAPGGAILLADPFRDASFPLLESLEADGWRVSLAKWMIGEGRMRGRLLPSSVGDGDACDDVASMDAKDRQTF